MTQQNSRPRRAVPAVFFILGIALSAVGISGSNDTFLWIGLAFFLIAIGIGLRQYRDRQK